MLEEKKVLEPVSLISNISKVWLLKEKLLERSPWGLLIMKGIGSHVTGPHTFLTHTYGFNVY